MPPHQRCGCWSQSLVGAVRSSLCAAAKETVVGWYSTGPKVREADLDIHEMIGNYVASPVLVVIDVQPQELGLPTSAYTMVEEVASARALLYTHKKRVPPL